MALLPPEGSHMMSEINVTPLVDVMLVLLVIFIVTAPLLIQTVNVQLPKTAATEPASVPHKALLSIQSDGRYQLDARAFAPEAMETEMSALAGDFPEVNLTLQADEAVAFGHVARAMAAAERAGITRISVLTAPR